MGVTLKSVMFMLTWARPLDDDADGLDAMKAAVEARMSRAMARAAAMSGC